jgi:hypothetical protein
MDPRKNPQRLDVREQRLEKIITSSLLLPLVKPKAFLQVRSR